MQIGRRQSAHPHCPRHPQDTRLTAASTPTHRDAGTAGTGRTPSWWRPTPTFRRPLPGKRSRAGTVARPEPLGLRRSLLHFAAAPRSKTA